MSPIPLKLQKEIETDLIYGIVEPDGKKKYLNLKQSAEHYNVDYVALRKLAGKWNWKQRRESHRTKVDQKVEEKKSEYDAECIVQSDEKFQNTGEKLRRSIDLKIDGVLSDLEEGAYVKPYDLKMLGDALSSAQAVVKNAQGEILERSEVNVAGGLRGFNEAIKTSRQKIQKTSKER